MTYSRAKVKGQRSIGSEDRLETQTDGGDYITSHANAVGNDCIDGYGCSFHERFDTLEGYYTVSLLFTFTITSSDVGRFS